ncbi:MAG: GNAT family N-acetyltransferase [Kofleriaceae bacterium]
MPSLRAAGPDDHPLVLPWTQALNAHEGIDLAEAALAAALAELLAAPAIGRVWIIEDAGAAVGYALVTFGYDLEFHGRDAVLTELWLEPAARGAGVGAAALALLEPQLRELGVHALHLQVRPDNPARRLYERAGFVASPRVVMTRRLAPG